MTGLAFDEYCKILESAETTSCSSLPDLVQVSGSPLLVLINTPAFDYSSSPYRGVAHDRRPPIGLHALKGAVERRLGWGSAAILDMEAQRLAPVEVAQMLASLLANKNLCPVVGVNGYSPNRELVRRVVLQIREVCPDLPILLGGRLVSIELDPRTRGSSTLSPTLLGDLGRLGAVTAFIGEADAVLADAVADHRLLGRHSLGFARCEMEKVLVPERLVVFEGGKVAPAPTYRATAGRGEMYHTVISSRSCAHRCSFCAANYFPVRMSEMATVEAQIEALADSEDRTINIDFLDDNVFQNATRGKAVIRMMESLQAKAVSVRWRSLARGDTLRRLASDGYLDRAANAGLEEVAIGLESVSDAVLKRMSKGASFGDLEGGIAGIQSAGIRPKLFAMLGAPEETSAEMEATVRYLMHATEIGARWSLFIRSPYAGTEDYSRLRAAGWGDWDLQLYTEAAARGGALVDHVDRADIRLGTLPLGELIDLIEHHVKRLAGPQQENLGEDCCASRARCGLASSLAENR